MSKTPFVSGGRKNCCGVHNAALCRATCKVGGSREYIMDMREPGDSYCRDCPDHEACFMGYPCELVRSVANEDIPVRPVEEKPVGFFRWYFRTLFDFPKRRSL